MPFRTSYDFNLRRRPAIALAIALCGLSGIWSVTAASAPLHWQSPARLRGRMGSRAGWLIVGPEAIEFRSSTGGALRWPFFQIRTAKMTPHRLVMATYENRRWHWPGERSYRFDLKRRMPPPVAAALADLVEKPVINADPAPPRRYFAMLAACHRTLAGEANGNLIFSRRGINFIPARGRGGQSWRWADIQTLARPDAYHLIVGGYREMFDFELKQPMSWPMFDRLWDLLYGGALQSGS